MPYHVCDDCAVVLENSDTSHIAESDMETVLSNVELIGRVVRSGEYDSAGTWYCHLCYWTFDSAGHEYERI